MPVDPLALLAAAAAVVTGAVALLVVVTLGVSVRAWRADRRRERARERVRAELFDRRTLDDPDWERWIEQLSRRERSELESLVERYLRTVRGEERRVYLDVAGALGMGERADAALDRSEVLPRLRALARLSLLEYPVSEERLLETCLDDSRTREAAARLLYERRDEFDVPRPLGTAFLVWDGREPMTARGLETLFDLNRANPVTLLSQGFWSAHQWETAVLVQVCTVLEACQTPARPVCFSWVFPLFDYDEPAVRAAAIRVFGGIGWREELREDVPFRALVTDEDPRVRRATYRTLARWGDERAHGLLEWAVVDEDDERAQLLAVEALAALEGTPDADQPGWPGRSWRWVRTEHEAVSRRVSAEGVVA